MKDEALRLALEAYLCREMPAGTVIGDPKWWAAKIANAIKEALAQPAQEPVAYVTGMSFGRFIVEPLNTAMVLPVGMALYSAPQGNK